MLTTPLNRRLLAAVLVLALGLFAPAVLGGYREDMHATPVEIAQLPLFCWKQFEVPSVEGDEFRIRDCGDYANHYCPGLIYLIRGKSSAAKGKGFREIQVADSNVAYTEHGIANYPRCSIREHVEATRAEINHLLRMFGAKPQGSK